MSQDRPFNSKTLKERFPEVYKKFYAENDIVVSGAFNFSLSPGIIWRAGAPLVRLKLPLKCYVGIKVNNGKSTVSNGSYLVYNTSKDKFNTNDCSLDGWCEHIDYLQELVRKKWSNDFNGITLNYLFESSDSRGIDSSFETVAMSAIYLYLNRISIEEFKQFPSTSSAEILKGETKLAKDFRDIHRQTLKMISKGMNGGAAGNSSYSSLLDSKLPMVYFTEERAGSEKKPYKDKRPFILDDMEKAEKLEVWGFRLDELADVTGYFPLDVVGIYPGASKEPGLAAEYVHKSLMPSFDIIRDKTKKLFSKAIDLDSDRLPPFLKELDVDGKYWHDYAVGQSYQLVNYVFELIELYQNKLSGSVVTKFLEHQSILRNINGVFEDFPSKNLQTILDKIKRRASEVDEKVGLRPLYWGKMDGNIFAFSPLHRFREQSFKLVEEIRRDHNENVQIDFCSWRDGWGSDGVRLEQYIKKDIYSEFLDKNSLKLEVWDNKDEVNSIVSMNELDKADFDLLLDKIDGKLYIKGKNYSSKELPSQKATIELVEFLLQNVGQPVTNKQLSESGYSKYRNELQGKIVTPLSKLLKEKTGKDLGLKVTGKLMNFFIEFNPKNLKIGIIDKI
ncbi:hypothetical protein HN858_02195 [Candidatus Falkowbacteria bacterium]|jgi:hypothetical protein|nr:hypothetical protein [Candidatus Falkowbacteria bacterium]MBT5502805.1 hypothetical protein [Candidatus Falkowbacteria bacterium]MBT6573424.1 hypothetical protein [Candidatus Falkowbacteria bacterium]MBT7348466.1 hypothetical protein [Candidatus Falkowbacteria bacterium]MBT7501190.1 hypothetical protein [Candidatus Falkowbacteria bacterium]